MKKGLVSPRRWVIILALPVVALSLAVGLTIRQRASAATTGGTYSDLYWPTAPASGYNSVEHDLRVDYVTPKASYFWSHQVSFIHGRGGGYFGMQSGSTPNTFSPIVLFSLWDTVNARGTNCGPFGGEGVGMHCSLVYNWTAGRTYHFKMMRLENDANGTWWRASVTDTTTGITSIIGEIENLPGWEGLGTWSTMWTEHFAGTHTTCNAIPYSQVEFSNMKMNGQIGPGAPPVDHVGTGDCSLSKISATANGRLQQTGELPGDINGDKQVSLTDLSIFASNYGRTSATLVMGDFNNDNVVGIADLSTLATYWGRTY